MAALEANRILQEPEGLERWITTSAALDRNQRTRAMDKTELLERMGELRWRVANDMATLARDPKYLNTVDHAITALTQDRAAVRNVLLDDLAHYFVREHMRHAQEKLGDYVLDGNDIAEILRALKTSPAQAEPKLYERRYGDNPTVLSPDTRNPAEADRRLTKLGNPIIAQERCTATRFGRRACDRARWVTSGGYAFDQTGEMVDHKIKLTTPPTPPAAEVPMPLYDWVHHNLVHRSGRSSDATATLGDIKSFCRELDKRGRGSWHR